MFSFIARPRRRVLAVVAVLAVGVPGAGLAAAGSPRPDVVHTHVERSGTIVVSGYDGGVPVAPAP